MYKLSKYIKKYNKKTQVIEKWRLRQFHYVGLLKKYNTITTANNRKNWYTSISTLRNCFSLIDFRHLMQQYLLQYRVYQNTTSYTQKNISHKICTTGSAWLVARVKKKKCHIEFKNGTPILSTNHINLCAVVTNTESCAHTSALTSPTVGIPNQFRRLATSIVNSLLCE